MKLIDFPQLGMFVLYDTIDIVQNMRDFDKKKASNIARGDISRAGIIFLQGLQLRVLLRCGYYSREGLI